MDTAQHSDIIASYNPESSVGTEFRRLIYNLTNNPLLPENSKTFLITSASVGEGKSTISSFLAITAAVHRPRKTLLIDADLRRPVQHTLFGLEQKPGLAEIISGEAKMEDCIRTTSLPSLHIITSGKIPENPTELFDAPSISTFLEAAKFYFELIIIDCAPIIPVSDPLILGNEVDGICLVVKAGVTQREVVFRARDLIDQSGARLVGIVLNNVKEALPYYYNHKYYGYHYASSSAG